MKAKNSLMGMLCLINKLLKIRHILTLVLVFMCVGVQDSTAQTKKTKTIDELPELKVGDAVPEELWNHPMELWTAADGSVKTITLNDYRGKVIILDFWATSCVGCIQSFPYVHNLQKKGGKDVIVMPITSQRGKDIQSYLNNTTYASFLEIKDEFQSIVEQRLRNLFPFRGIPHIVVINRRGEVQGITIPMYLNHEMVSQLVNNEKEVYIPFKRSGLDVPFLAPSNAYNDVKTYGASYYSSVIRFTDGVGHLSAWYPDSLANTVRFVVPNYSIVRHYRGSRQFGTLPMYHNRTILEVSDVSSYFEPSEISKQTDFMREHYYSYEALLPIDLTREEANAKKRQDLDLFLGLNSKVEKRKVNCLVLKVLKGYVIPDSLKEDWHARSQSLATTLNSNQYRLPPIIDEAGDEECILPTTFPPINILRDVNKLRAWIQGYGLDLVPTVREIDMFVLSDKGMDPVPMNELELTEYGYVPKLSLNK